MYAPAGLLYVPVVVWVGSGIGLLAAYRRSTPGVVLRLAALFLGLWALLATTVLVWVLLNGGGTAVLALVHTPLLLFQAPSARYWLEGGAGAFCVVAAAFLLNQLVGRSLLHVLRPRELTWPTSLPRPASATSLLRFESARPEAFSFTLLEFGRRSGYRPRRHEVIVLSRALLEILTPEETVAAIAHELGHVRGLDSRYLTFLRTFARIMAWDPLLAYIAWSLTRREEYRADWEAARLTKNPLALARALYKVLQSGGSLPPPLGAAAFLGIRGRRGPAETLDRIRRLVALADSGDYEGSARG
jgi:Zn-dependent protease with chaperone function